MSSNGTIDKPADFPAPAAVCRDDGTKMFVYVSDLLGRPVVGAGGRRPGKLADLKVRLGEHFPRIVCLHVRRGRKKIAALDWAEVASFSGKKIVLVPGAEDRFAAPDVRSDEILLKEELLDKQVVDTHGAKIERVNDVHLLIIGKDLRIVHVDIGLRGILRRIGLLRPAAWAARFFFEYEIPEALITWKAIQPLAADASKKDLKLNVAAGGLHELHPSDLADILEDLDRENQKRVFKTLDLETAADTLQEVEPKLQLSLIESASAEKASDLLEEMDPDEATDLLSELPEEKKRKLFQTMEKPSREVLQELLTYEEGTAGRIMTTDYLSVGEDQTVGDAVLEFKNSTHPLESVAYIFVRDGEGRLKGVITLRQLLLTDKETPVRDIMNTHLVRVWAEDDVRSVAEIFGKYKFLMVPVVDEDNVLVGIITFQDIMEERCPL